MIGILQAFKFDDSLEDFLHHEIEKTADEWRTTEPFTIFEELQAFLKSHFVYVHQFSKMIIGEEKHEISSQIIYTLGNKTLSLRNDQVDWMQLLDRHVEVEIEPLFQHFQNEQILDLDKSYFCGGSLFTAHELLETSEDTLLKKYANG